MNSTQYDSLALPIALPALSFPPDNVHREALRASPSPLCAHHLHALLVTSMAQPEAEAQVLTPEQVDLALSTMHVRFVDQGDVIWTLGCTCFDGGSSRWPAERSAALLDALSSLAVIGGLPISHEPKHKGQWVAALSGLRVVRESLVGAGGAPAPLCDSCKPGYAPDSTCRQVRLSPLSPLIGALLFGGGGPSTRNTQHNSCFAR